MSFHKEGEVGGGGAVRPPWTDASEAWPFLSPKKLASQVSIQSQDEEFRWGGQSSIRDCGRPVSLQSARLRWGFRL